MSASGDRLLRFAWFLWLTSIIFSIFLWAGVIYVVMHFVLKFW